MEFEEIQIAERFWCFEQRGVRSFLLEGDGEALLVDTCFGGDLTGLCRSKTDMPLRVVLTHGDRDHTGGLSAFPKFWMHPDELPCFLKKNGFPEDQVPSGFLPIREGDTLSVGNFCFTVIHIPGHTPGSIALAEFSRRFLIGGDSVQIGPIYMFGEGRDLTAYRESMEQLDAVKDSFDRVYSSHNQLVVPPDVISELRDFAGEILVGTLPEPQPAPAFLPDSVALYQKGRTAFYLDRNQFSKE